MKLSVEQILTNKWWRRGLLGLILLLALFLRVYRLTSVPVGINGDEMFNAIDAALVGKGHWPLFFEGNQGREALFIYLMAASMSLLGKSIFAFRLPAAILGTGNVLLGYVLGRDLFNRRVGLLTAGLTAVSLWPLMESRWGMRAVSLTFFTALTLFLLQRGFQSGQRRYWLAGGAALGLTLYTYIPSRVFPVVILVWIGWLFWRQREQARQNWQSMVLSLGLATLVFAPFGWYMIQYPDKVNQRVDNLSSALNDALAGDLTALAGPTRAVLRMFTIEGDHEWRYHVFAEPVFDPLTGLFFYVGTAVALWRTFAPSPNRTRRDGPPSYALLLLWAGAMLSPNALIDNNASFLRAAGAIIPLYLLTAVGLDTLYAAVKQKWAWVGKRPYLLILVTIGLGFTLADTWHNYFDIWNNNDVVRDVYQADITAIGLYLKDASFPADQRVFIAHPYAYDAAPRMLSYYTDQPVSWFVPSEGFAWQADVENYYLVPIDEDLDTAALPPDLLATAVTDITYDNGDTAFHLVRLSGSQIAKTPQQAHPITFISGPAMTGYDVPDTFLHGETIPIISYWQIPADQSASATRLTYVQVYLEDEQGRVWGQNGSLMAYPQANWHSGDQFIQKVDLEIPDGLPPGPIYLRFELSNNDGDLYEIADTAVNLAGPFMVRSRPLADFALQPDMLLFDNRIIFREATLSTMTEPGLPIDISLDWVAWEVPALDYRVQFELAAPGADEPILTQLSGILPDTYPTSQWQAREQIRSLHRLDIPFDIPTDHETLILRLQLVAADGETAVPITQGNNQIAEINLVLRDHLFEPPAITHPVTAQFGAAIQLLGYDVAVNSSDSGKEIGLTLYWQALDTPADHYTVFNHILDASGQLAAQFDSPPVSEAWLTGAWLPGEIVIDRRTIPLDAGVGNGRYAIAIGLYNEDGRLPVMVDGQPQANDQLILTEVAIE